MARRTESLFGVTGLLLAVATAAALVALFQLRFAAGDVYPPYSSLRSDPLGTRVLYEALSDCSGIQVERAYEPTYKLDLDPASTILVLGAGLEEHMALDGTEVGQLQGFLRRGGRLVLTVFPTQREPGTRVFDRHDEEEEEPEQTAEDESGDEAPEEGEDDTIIDVETPSAFIKAGEWLGVDFSYSAVETETRAVLTDDARSGDLPYSLTCHTTLTFTNVTEEWETIYTRDGEAVVLEKHIGSGSLVLSALSYVVSNEAMRSERRPRLLTWLVGPQQRVIFDEHHHGIMRSEGVVTLAWKYRMHWLAATLLLLAVLYAWHSSYAVVPYRGGDATGSSAATGRGSISGLVNLLRRNIPKADLEAVCFERWLKARGHRLDADRTARVRALLTTLDASASRKKNVVDTHESIRAVLSAAHNRADAQAHTEGERE